jgi:hypothetical protein
MLTSQQKAAIERGGPRLAALLLAQMPNAGPDAPVAGFQCTPPKKEDVENWLAHKLSQDKTQQVRTLIWAIVAGVASIVSVLIAIATWLLPSK